MTKLHNVAPFKYSYIVTNLYTGKKFEADTIGEALWYAKLLMKDSLGSYIGYSGHIAEYFNNGTGRKANHWIGYTEHKAYSWSRAYIRQYVRRDAFPLVMQNNLGAIIHPDEIAEHRVTPPPVSGKSYKQKADEREARRTKEQARRVWTKDNVNKLKMHYSVVPNPDWWSEYDEMWCSSYHRRIKTTQEHRMNEAHMSEYGDEMVRGKRRYRQLPNSWDDVPTGIWDGRKCWKHNSKRRKQWVPKD